MATNSLPAVSSSSRKELPSPPDPTTEKVNAFVVVGRVLVILGTLLTLTSFVLFFVATPISPVVLLISSIALALLGMYVATGTVSASFRTGQPIGLVNSGNNCWINALVQFIMNVPSLQKKMESLSAMKDFLRCYQECERGRRPLMTERNSEELRTFLRTSFPNSGATLSGQIDAAEALHLILNNIEQESSIRMIVFGSILAMNLPWQEEEVLFRHDRPLKQLVQQDPSFQLKVEYPSINGKEPNVPSFFCDAFVCYEGSSPGGGHYVAYVKKEKIWWLCDDATISSVDEGRVKEAIQRGYLFHYRKRLEPSASAAWAAEV